MRRGTSLQIFILAWVVAAFCQAHSAELNGYTFSDDSTELWENPFFSSMTRLVDLDMVLYGYGEFYDRTFTQTYHQPYTIGGVECVILYEQGYYPTYSSLTRSFDLDYYIGYLYYAKDIEDNIHILSLWFDFQDQPDVTWEYTDLPEGGTTLKYPSAPAVGQEVFCGEVTGAGVEVGETGGCMTILFDSLPQFPSRSVTEYLRPGSGLLAVAYNWEGGYNGFSFDGGAPELAEEEKHGWDKWKDEHCFISVCTLPRAHPIEDLRRVACRVLKAVKGQETP